jgi:competence protein ComEC
MKRRLAFPSAIALLVLASAHGETPRTPDIYFIDVEGGQSTLLITPKRQSFLIDTGWAASGMPGSKPGDNYS